MNSPFLDRPTAEHVAANELGFAIRDAFPVSPGHTLVVTRRLIATWFDATAEEHAALIALVNRVKVQLDESHAPHGYNVGFNAEYEPVKVNPAKFQQFIAEVVSLLVGDMPTADENYSNCSYFQKRIDFKI